MRKCLITAAMLLAFSATPAMSRAARTVTTSSSTNAFNRVPATPPVSKSRVTASTTQARPARIRGGGGQPLAKPPITTLATATTVDYNSIDSVLLNTFNTDSFGATLSGSPGSDFNVLFDFLLDSDVTANAQVSTIDLAGVGVSFSSILLDGLGGAFTVNPLNPMQYILDPTQLAMGPHSISVLGTIGSAGSGSFGGNINLTQPGAVPEPGTWGMMLLGFAGIGFAVRRKRRSAPMQVA